jgi:hypothetical protein
MLHFHLKDTPCFTTHPAHIHKCALQPVLTLVVNATIKVIYLSDIASSHCLPVMSSASTQPGLCKPNSVPTFIPDVDMTTDWCVTPEQGNATALIMQQCCTSAGVQSIDGCSFCYTEDSTAADKQEFNRNFAQCLFRGPQNQNLSRESASYCNTPTVSN